MNKIGVSKVIFILSAFTVALSGCFDTSNEDENNGNVRATKSVSLSRILEIAPPVDVQTPASFQNTAAFKAKRNLNKVSARTSSASNFCDSVAGDRFDPTSEIVQCMAIHEVKERFFDGGPTMISDAMGRVDGIVSELLAGGTDYIPCLDRANTEGGSLGFGENITDYVAFSEAAFSLQNTFPDGSSFDTGVSYSLSCIRENQSEQTWVGVGQKDGSSYLMQGGEGNNGLVIIDPNTNIDYWYTVEWMSESFNFTTPVEYVGTGGADYDSLMSYLGSTALVHVRSNAGTNTIELSMTGVGVGDGCGARLLTDGSYLFYEANRNYYSRCAADDVNSTIVFDNVVESITYDAAFDGLTYCFDVTGEEPTSATMTQCTDRGLAAEDFVVDMLTRAELKAYNVLKLFPEMPTNIAPFMAIPYPEVIVPDESDLATYVEDNIYFPNIAQTNNRTAGFCKDQADTVAGAIDTTFELDLSTISTEELAKLNGAYAVRVYAQVDSGFKEKSTYSYWSDFTATATLTRNDVAVGDAIILRTDSIDGIQNMGYVLEDVAFEATDKLKINMVGTSKYACSEGAADLGSAATGVGMGRVRLAYYTPPMAEENGEQMAP